MEGKHTNDAALILKADSAWNAISSLNITNKFSEVPYKAGIYFYPPTQGTIDPNKAKWIVFLYYSSNLSSARNWDLLKSGKRWNILQVTYNADMVHHDSTTYYVKFDGDTIINTHKYRHVYRAANTEFNDKTLDGFVREDSLVSFYYRTLQGKEGLLYKYNLHLGDSVYVQNKLVHMPWDSIRFKVAGVDSILIDGKYKKRYSMSKTPYEAVPAEFWVEGIGSSLGILGSGIIGVVGGATKLLCCYDNNVLIYKNPDYLNCYYSTHTALHSVKNSESEIKVYSGTVPNVVIIKSQVDNYIRIFNCYGMFVEAVHLLANQECRLNVSNYPKGIYIISPSTNISGAKKFSRL